MKFAQSTAVKSVNWLMPLVCIVALGCTTKSELANDDANASSADVSAQHLADVRAEMEVGRNMAGRLLQYYGTIGDAGLIEYVNQVGIYVARFSEAPERKYMFEVLNSDMVNAFACPGGYILVTAGALRHAQSEAELAAILAHEIAHVGRKHMFDTLKTMSAEELEAANAAGKKRKIAPEVAARQRPQAEDSAIAQTLAKYISGSVAGLNILQVAGAGMTVILDKGLGAEKEYEADEHGLKYAVAAGYAPDALQAFLCRLQGDSGKIANCQGQATTTTRRRKTTSADVALLNRTHPPVADRLGHVDKVLAKMDAKDIVGAVGRKRYQQYRQRL